MSFEWVNMLWLLVLMPVLVIIYLLMQKQRQKCAEICQFPSYETGTGQRSRHETAYSSNYVYHSASDNAYSFGAPICICEITIQQATVILAIDVSMSMRAEDINLIDLSGKNRRSEIC